MNRPTKLNPVLGLSGIVALLAAVWVGVRGTGNESQAIAGVGRGYVLANHATTRSAQPHREIVGSVQNLGQGSIRSWVRVDERTGYPVSLGVTFDERALLGLPKGKGWVDGGHCCEGPAWELAIPAGIDGLPFTHVLLNWNPDGHEPKGVYDLPHFDFHFYMQSAEERKLITAQGDDLAKCTKPLPADQTPAGYVMAPGGVPGMGAHWIAASAPELAGKRFTQTFLYGSYDGRLTFIEPMITKEWLDTRPQLDEPLALPKSYGAPGFYPTRWSVRFDEAKREYTIALEALERK